ncbi:MAG: sodium/proline symporter [Emcibacteraceae bacterium]|nr:sodium/proline symporter [Emcibacteraceae bacterium]MDG1995397.1 sodium/proline symporter [Emcibacteraceae bacterium]
MIEKYSMLILYLGILIALSIVASKRVSNIKGYITGNKKLGFWVAAFSAQATGESAWLLLGVTGMGAMVGFSAYWVVVGEMFGVAVAWFFMAERYKKLTDHYDSITMTDYLVSRFKANTNILRIVASISLTIFILIYISAQIDATGSAFERFLEWDYHTGAIVGFAIVVLYSVLGGFTAVAWTDMSQGAVMVVSLVALPLVAYMMLGPSDHVYDTLQSIDPGLVNVWGNGGLTPMNFAVVLGMMLIGLGFLGSPQVFARFLAIKNVEEIKRGRWVALMFTFLVDASAVSVGVLGRYLFVDSGADPTEVLGNGAQNVLPSLVEYVFPMILVGLYVAAVLSAIMSTVSSLLIVAAGTISHDLYRKVYGAEMDDAKSAKVSRWLTVMFAVVALGIAITVSIVSPSRTIFWFVIFGWSGIAAVFCPMVIMSLFWKGFTAKGAIASMIAGFAMTILAKFVFGEMDVIGPYFVAMETMPPAFLFSFVVGYIVSIMEPDKELAKNYENDLKAIGETGEKNNG